MTTIYVGDALTVLAKIPDQSVHCVVSSPPYWTLRNYKGEPDMIGFEPTFEQHLDNLMTVFREVYRVLRDDGSFWLNYGDAYVKNNKPGGGNPGRRASGHSSRGGMKALSIKQPHADWILFAGKDIENRSWKLPRHMYGQRIYVHAGLTPDIHQKPIYGQYGGKSRMGKIIGEVTIIDCVESSDSMWFYGPYGFVLDDPFAYEEPIPCKGMLGFFTPDFLNIPGRGFNHVKGK